MTALVTGGNGGQDCHAVKDVGAVGAVTVVKDERVMIWMNTYKLSRSWPTLLKVSSMSTVETSRDFELTLESQASSHEKVHPNRKSSQYIERLPVHR